MDKDEIFAAAVKYDEDKDNAPKVVAKGKGEVALKIIKKEKESNVPVVTDSVVAQLLGYVRLGEEIPEELYEAVAKILVFVMQIDSRNKGDVK